MMQNKIRQNAKKCEVKLFYKVASGINEDLRYKDLTVDSC